MCEEGTLRGDDILHEHGQKEPAYTGDTPELDNHDKNWHVDLSEEDREGDEMSGDDHSSGLEGDEAELEGQSHISTDFPGDRTKHEDQESRTEKPAGGQTEIPRVSHLKIATGIKRIK